MNIEKLTKAGTRLHNRLLKRRGAKAGSIREGGNATQETARDAADDNPLHRGKITTRGMAYDTIDETSLRQEFDGWFDYTRFRTFELVADEIKRRFTPEELSRLCVAEAGVFEGAFAWIVNAKFPECEMYLYDTFEGFDADDLADEVNRSFTKGENLEEYSGYFGNPAKSPEQRIEVLKKRMKHWDSCRVRKGYFPESADGERDKRWVFVSLDMDLYHPMKEGLFYFWPNLVEGGFMFIHDYNNKDFAGIKAAVAEAEQEFGRMHKAPISDQGGTLILCK